MTVEKKALRSCHVRLLSSPVVICNGRDLILQEVSERLQPARCRVAKLKGCLPCK